MPDDFKYSLTRLCLRSGQLTLPRTMLELFPSEGTVRAFDTVNNQEHNLTMLNPRTVSGLSNFFENNSLEVNDELSIRLLEDERYAFTAKPRPKKQKKVDLTHVSAQILDQIAEKATPLSIPEIRAAFDVADELELESLLENDSRFTKQAGRWQLADKDAVINKDNIDRDSVETQQTVDNSQKNEVSKPNISAVDDADTNKADTTEIISLTPKPKRATVTPIPRGVMFPDEAGLNSASQPEDLGLQNKARKALEDFGFEVDGLHGYMLAKADLGRQKYDILVHCHPENERLDWAKLLTRRRETGSKYLAVFGEHRDLLRLVNPAEMARATLWSWQALERAQELLRTVAISPMDLEPHFERDGLFEHGLERFEKAVGERIAERGLLSSVLERLAAMKAPSIFLLEDVVADLEMPRDQILKHLDMLSLAPFHMVTRVDSGEFCLRYSVSKSLQHVADYAGSLSERLPKRHHERVQADTETESTVPSVADLSIAVDSANKEQR